MEEMVGLIHRKVYRKIQIQEALNQSLVAISTQGKDILMDVDQEVGLASVGKLEEIIEPDNVHGWLQSQMTIVEQRMIYILKKLLLKGVDKVAITECVEHFAMDYQVVASNCEEAWNLINDYMINGMPCDHVIKTQVSENQIQVNFVENIHLQNLEQYEVDPELFEEVRYAFVRGLLDPVQFELGLVDSNYIIRKI